MTSENHKLLHLRTRVTIITKNIVDKYRELIIGGTTLAAIWVWTKMASSNRGVKQRRRQGHNQESLKTSIVRTLFNLVQSINKTREEVH